MKYFVEKYAAIFLLGFLLGCNKGETLNNSAQSSYSLKPKPIALTLHCKGYYEYLPEGYSPNGNMKFPLLIFFHGGGEIGSDSADLDKTLKNGPLKLVSTGSFPTFFTVSNRVYRFIIIAPQFTSSDNSFPDEIDKIIEYLKQNYRVDVSRIYLTGLSFGGGLCWNYVGEKAAYAHKIAAMVPVASYLNDQRDEFKIDAAKAQTIASSHVPIWSTHNDRDNICPLSWITDADSLLVNSHPPINPKPKLTIFNAYGHEGWTQTYDPTFKENNLNIYQWMLQYHR